MLESIRRQEYPDATRSSCSSRTEDRPTRPSPSRRPSAPASSTIRSAAPNPASECSWRRRPATLRSSWRPTTRLPTSISSRGWRSRLRIRRSSQPFRAIVSTRARWRRRRDTSTPSPIRSITSSTAAPLRPLRTIAPIAVKRRTDELCRLRFRIGPMPLIALAQAFAIRLPYRKPSGTDEDDVAPVEMLLARGARDRVRRGRHVRAPHGARYRRRAAQVRAALSRANERIPGCRVGTAARVAGARSVCEPIFGHFTRSASLLPAAAAAYGLVRDRRAEWLYHPFLSAAFGFEFWRQAGIVARRRVQRTSET